MLVCNLLHGCRVVLAWRRWEKKKKTEKDFVSFLLFLFVCFLKWICSPLLRVTTNHLYSLGKCRFLLDGWWFFVRARTFPALVPASFPSCKCLWEIIDSLVFSVSSVPGLWKWTLDVLSRLLETHRDGEKLLVLFSCVYSSCCFLLECT